MASYSGVGAEYNTMSFFLSEVVLLLVAHPQPFDGRLDRQRLTHCSLKGQSCALTVQPGSSVLSSSFAPWPEYFRGVLTEGKFISDL